MASQPLLLALLEHMDSRMWSQINIFSKYNSTCPASTQRNAKTCKQHEHKQNQCQFAQLGFFFSPFFTLSSSLLFALSALLAFLLLPPFFFSLPSCLDAVLGDGCPLPARAQCRAVHVWCVWVASQCSHLQPLCCRNGFVLRQHLRPCPHPLQAPRCVCMCV